jgi:cholesterol transport system auxiliary component
MKKACLLLLLGLVGCATNPLPDYRYYRPSPSLPVSALAKPLLSDTIEVQYFRADGVLGERPIVYTSSDEPQKLSQYHYQLWTDPPGAILQRRMSDLLAQYGIAKRLTVRASAREEPIQLTGTIERLERIKSGAGTQVAVALRLRLEAHRAQTPMLEKRYEKLLSVSDDSISASVHAFGLACDQITAEFVQDLSHAGISSHASKGAR